MQCLSTDSKALEQQHNVTLPKHWNNTNGMLEGQFVGESA